MKCAQPPQRPLQSLHIEAYTQTHCAATPHSMCADNTHTHTPQQLANNQPTNKPTNQPTNQPPHPPAKLNCARTNQPTTSQPTQQPTKQPANQQPTNQQAKHQCTRGGGGSKTWEEGGQSIPLTRTAAQCITQLGGGGGEGGGMVGRGNLYTRQPHTTDKHGREEGRKKHLPLPVTVYPLLDIHIGIKKTSTPAKRKWIPTLTLSTTSRGPTTQTTTWKGGRGGGGGLIA